MDKKRCVTEHKDSTQEQKCFSWKRCLTAFGLVGLALIVIGIVPRNAQGLPVRGASGLRSWTSLYARLPLSFEVNRGQTNSQVKYLARGQGYTLFLKSHEAVLTLHTMKDHGTRGDLSHDIVLILRMLGASSSTHVSGENLLAERSNYFLGNNPSNWHTDIPNYARILYLRLYPGINLVYYGRQGQLENDFMLSPGADPRSIRIGLKGVKGMHIDPAGNLVLKVSGGRVYLRRPHAYQGRGAERKTVAVHYVLRSANQVGFEVGSYNRRQRLVIDPVLAYSTYLGGDGGDVGSGIAVDSSGDAYIAGVTNSSNFPVTPGVQSSGFGGNGDVFVAKIDPTGTAGSSTSPQLVYSTYLGGSGEDSGEAIAVNAGGDAFVTGSTTSSDFPTTSGAFQTTYGGSGDAFVTELNNTGSSLDYSSYLGGSGADAGYGIALDSSGDAYITGTTQSPDLKTTLNALQPNNAGSSDAFVAQVNFTGSQLLYLSYLGGSQADVGQSIQVDSSGDAYVAGYTFSSNFPLQNPLQGANDGTVNAFVSEIAITSSTSSLKFSTYFGGDGDDQAHGLALDKSGNIYITGSSTSNNFPTSVGAFQITNHGQSDAFVAEINPSGPTLVYSTLLGGSGTDQANGIALDSSGDAYITGFTNSSDYPTQNAIQNVLGVTGGGSCGTTACSDAFVTEVNPTGTSLVQSTFLGGSNADIGQAIALGPTGNAYVTGSTSSTNYPAVAGAYPAYQSSLNGVAGNAFVAEIAPTDAPSIALVPGTLDFGNVTQNVRSAVQSVTVINEGTSALNITKITFAETDNTGYTSDFAESDDCGGIVAASGGYCAINITFTPSTYTAESGTFSIEDNAAGSPQIINVSGTGVRAPTTVTVNSTGLSFGNVTVGDISSAQTVTVANTGSANLAFTGINTGTNFVIDSTKTTCTTTAAVAPGGSCQVAVYFAPTTTGTFSGTLVLADNTASSPQSVSLSGTGTAPVLTVTPTSLTFGSQVVGTTSTAESVTVTNTGTASLSLSSFTATGNFAVDTAATTCSTSTALAVNAKCAVGVTFTPTATGTRTGSLDIASNGGSSTVALTGTGAAPGVTLNPSSLTFSSTLVGKTSSAQSVMLTNSGNSTLTISGLKSSGDFAIDSTGTTCMAGLQVAASKSCSIAVTFTPTAGGTRTGAVTITDNASSSPQTVALSGTGEDFSLGASTTSETVAPGGSTGFDLLLSPQGGFNQSISLACSNAPAHATCSVNPTSVTLNGTNATSIQVKVSTAGNALVAPGPGDFGPPPSGSLPLTAWLAIIGLLGLMALVKFSPRGGRVRRAAPWATLALAAALFAGCGGGGIHTGISSANSTPAGTYTLTVKATSGSLSQSTQITLNVQ